MSAATSTAHALARLKTYANIDGSFTVNIGVYLNGCGGRNTTFTYRTAALSVELSTAKLKYYDIPNFTVSK